MQWRSTLRLCLILAALGLAAAFLQRLPGDDVAGAATAIDGDSLRLDDREIRLKGIDAPEYRQTCQGDRGEVARGPCGAAGALGAQVRSAVGMAGQASALPARFVMR